MSHVGWFDAGYLFPNLELYLLPNIIIIILARLTLLRLTFDMGASGLSLLTLIKQSRWCEAVVNGSVIAST
jgi:hypothetical protein